MRRWAPVLLAVLMLAGCGGDDGGDDGANAATATSTAPAATTTTPQTAVSGARDRISSCLTGLGYRLTGGAAQNASDPDSADYQIIMDGPRGGGYIGFYKNTARAKRVARQLRKNATQFTGAAVERHGAVNIVWVDLPDKAARTSVRGCLVDYPIELRPPEAQPSPGGAHPRRRLPPRMAERQLHGLQRVLGVNALFSTAYGNVGSSIYYALGLVAALAAGLTPLVFLITGALFYCTATTYAEATAMYPEAGGSSLFARRAFNELWSFFTAWAQMLNYIITIAISAFFAAHYAGRFTWEGFKEAPGDIAFAVGIVALLALVNVRGVKDAVSVNLVLAVIDFMSQLAIVALGAFLVFSPEILIDNLDFFGETPTLTQFLLAIPIGTVAYTGIETISNMAGEARDPDTTIPAAIKRVMIAVFAIYFTLPLIALSALPVECVNGECRTLLGVGPEDNGYANDPIIGVVSGMDLGWFEGPVQVYVGVLAVTILVAATNAGVLGVSRLTYSMGMYRQLPDTMRQLHRRYRTPYVGILVFSGFACLALLPGQADFLGKIYAFGAMLSFSMAHLSLICLRVTEPDVRRPYRSPGRMRVRGHELPPLAVVGLTGTILSFIVVSVLDLKVGAAGVLWMVLGMVGYLLYRRSQGLDFVSTHQVALPQPVTQNEAEYESVLVALDARHYSSSTIATATKLAGRKRRGIHVLVLITVPQASPLDAALPEEEIAARAVIEQARLQGGRRVSGHVERVRPGGSGRLISDEAREMRAHALVMPLPPRTGTTLFGKTVETVLADRPCRVIIESEPTND